MSYTEGGYGGGEGYPPYGGGLGVLSGGSPLVLTPTVPLVLEGL
jgi:hypothetical protein